MIRYCTLCAAPVDYRIPAGDTHPRAVCSRCGHIHYENPRLVVGGIAQWQGQLLLCRRAIEPRCGLWTLPAGFMENGETAEAAAARETREEANAEIGIDAAFALVSIAHINQVHLFFRGQLNGGIHSPGEESLESRLFAAAEIPWQELAFTSVRWALQRYLDDRERGSFGFHTTALSPR